MLLAGVGRGTASVAIPALSCRSLRMSLILPGASFGSHQSAGQTINVALTKGFSVGPYGMSPSRWKVPAVSAAIAGLEMNSVPSDHETLGWCRRLSVFRRGV